jgi:trehalose 6-phosphate phosphatase
MRLPAPLEVFAARPERAGVYTDFDGTLARIVDNPDEAHALEGAGETLAALAERYERVGVISGRPVRFLLDNVASVGVDLWGEYGLERVVDGEIRAAEGAAEWRQVVEDVASRADAADIAERVERKSLSVTLHWRADPEREAAVRKWALAEADRTGLEALPARKAIELRPPLRRDKGTALAEAAAGVDAVCFLGDDRGDLAAFDALDRMAADGVHVARIGVRSAEMPDELAQRADVIVDGPEGALALLRSLLP